MYMFACIVWVENYVRIAGQLFDFIYDDGSIEFDTRASWAKRYIVQHNAKYFQLERPRNKYKIRLRAIFGNKTCVFIK